MDAGVRSDGSLEFVAGFDGEVVFWAIQSPSETGLSTGFTAVGSMVLCPVEEVRGGIAFGDRSRSAIVEGPTW